MLAGPAKDLATSLSEFPKVELHRHLEGSLRLATIHDIVLRESLDLPHEADKLRRLVQVQPGDPKTPQSFLAKFEPLRRLFRSPEIVERLTHEAIADASAENIVYLELLFTPAALSQERGFNLDEVFEWVTAAAASAAAQYSIEVGLIASINRHESVAQGEAVAQAAVERMDRGVVGLSLAGDEVKFASSPFRDLLVGGRQAGLGVTIHAGEWDGAESVRSALDVSPDVRIGHGVRVIEDQDVVRMAVERRTVFEVCPTSNLQSGAVSEPGGHPLARMLEAGLQVTINTDDPGVSQISLADEYALAIKHLGLSLETIKGMILASAQAAFQPVQARKALEARLKSEFFGGRI